MFRAEDERFVVVFAATTVLGGVFGLVVSLRRDRMPGRYDVEAWQDGNMKFYAVAQLDVTDPSWVREYVAQVTPMVERHGGRYLARTTAVERLEGDGPGPSVVLLIEWPSREAAMAFYESDEYRPFREGRLAGARNDFLLVAGEDVNGVARID